MDNTEEKTKYDNYLDEESRKNDEYSSTLEKLMGEQVKPVLSEKKDTSGLNYKSIYVHFRNLDDLEDFCNRIGQLIPWKQKETYYPLENPDKALFSDDQSLVIDRDLLRPKKKSSTKNPRLKSNESRIHNDWQKHWKEMPDFDQKENPPYRSLTVKFRKSDHYWDFANKIGQELTEKTKSIWHPGLDVVANRKLRWIQPNGNSDVKYPLYIVSKDRHGTMFTSRSLARMEIPHYIVIEPQDEKKYEEALEKFEIKEFVTLLVAPFSNHGDGPGRARNWAWDHSMDIGADSHWVLDDNISDFYRLHENMRIRFESGVGFRVMEDFVNRYENVPIAGPQYRFFIAPNSEYPPFVTNTRIYSTLLIRNDCKHRWRGRYNEDTDLCLRVLKDGNCTVQFNAFLQGKAATQTVGGGNTKEFYHSEGDLDKEKWRDGQLNSEGTINKSQMLVDMHPDVTKLVWKYGRWHHHVNYEPFKKNRLQMKKGIELKDETNNYGMELITNYGENV